MVRSSPGRVRVHLAGWSGTDAERLQQQVASAPGVRAVSTRLSTRNMLVQYDERTLARDELLARIGDALGRTGEAASGHLHRVRIAVRGLDRDPALARRVVRLLQARPGVHRAVVSATTGRVLVEFSERVTSIQDLLGDVSRVELPDAPGRDLPCHPLDPAPIIQSGARALGSALGLALLAVQRATGRTGASGASATLAGSLGLIDGIPPARSAAHHALGRDRAQLVLGTAAVASLTLSGSPLGLLVSGVGALRLFTEARQRRDAWREYERRLTQVPSALPGSIARIEGGGRVPLAARVIEGAGTVIGDDGLPDPVGPGSTVEPGSRVLRGPLVCELLVGDGYGAQERPAPAAADALARYVTALGPLAVAYALVHAAVRRSPAALFTGLLLVNPRAAVVGTDFADSGASARVLRAGTTVVGSRDDRVLRRPDVLFIESPRTLVDGVEQTRVVPAPGCDRGEISALVAALVSASDGAWGSGLQAAQGRGAELVSIHPDGVSASVGTRRLTLRPADRDELRGAAAQALEAGAQPLALRDEGSGETLAIVHVRPRLAAGVVELRSSAERHGIELVLLERGDRRASRMLARRAALPLLIEAELVEEVRSRQRAGARVAVLSDSVRAAAAFDACDLAIGLSSGRSGQFQARADLLAPELTSVAAILDACAGRERAVNRSVAASIAGNLAGAVWGLQGEVGVLRASHATYLAALAAMGWAWQIQRGGRRSRSLIGRLTDPRPERWGRADPATVLRSLGSRAEGLSSDEAEDRRETRARARSRNAFARAMAEQLDSPLTAVLGGGAALSLAVGAAGDTAIIAAVILANAAVGAWQERQAGHAAQALERLGSAQARVLRDGEVRELPAEDVVPGDVLLPRSGDRVSADARILSAEGLEVDEAALTGESLPVAKSPDAELPAARVLLEGSDVTVGSGTAVAVAVGSGTRLGAIAAALSVEETGTSPLGERLDQLLRRVMPVVAAGGLLVAAAGVLWGGAPLAQLAVGASVAVAAVPEGLPLLAGVAEAAVARRLASRSAYVRRLSAVEALGRANVVCCDKTGTLTRGRLEVTVLDDLTRTAGLEQPLARESLSEAGRRLLVCAGLASPAPDAVAVGAHATDAAVLQAVEELGLCSELQAQRLAEVPFDPSRALHATATADRICVKGAAEAVLPRCSLEPAQSGGRRVLDEAARERLFARAEELAGRGLRVLVVAEGAPGCDLEDPQELTALGLIGISDPPRPDAAEALARCRAAGIRVVMVTGDHPATARAIAEQLALPVDDGSVLTGDQLEHLDNGRLAAALEHATVLARITPLDKLRIVEAFRASGHTVAMTGDGVNDAPALRLADVGVAMGAGGTDVARQAADLILGDDRFETLTDALLEGRSLWQNLHRSLGLLLGGNLGEVGLMAGAAIIGRGTVLGTRQILAINLITDVLPAVAVAVQPPRERLLDRVDRESTAQFDRTLRAQILRRGVATAAPALAAVLVAPALGAAAPVVAFGSIVATQLAQTLMQGREETSLSRPVTGAVGATAAVLGACLLVPPLRTFLALPPAGPASLGLILASAPAAVAVAGAQLRPPASAAIAAADGEVELRGLEPLASAMPWRRSPS